MADDLARVLERFRTVAEGGTVSRPKGGYETYAITNFRGGIGKSTLAFNLAWEVSRVHKTLLLDLCPQCNFTQSLLGDDPRASDRTIYDALLPRVMPGTPTIEIDDLLTSVPPVCPSFKNGERTYVIPGSNELFLFPSLLYTQISNAENIGARSKDAIKNILKSVETIAYGVRDHIKAKRILVDTSPFFGGATHLGWVAADALIIPVRVDQHSIEALKLTLSMLKDGTKDFLRLNEKAGIKEKPVVHAIVMTHCGWHRQSVFTPDRSTQAYLAQVIDIVHDNAELFSCGEPIDSIHILDDFHSAGRISGSKRIPMAMLENRQSYTIEGQRLEVNESVTRYQRELKSLALSI